jgi:HAD superfamily hydrolase (TIGR01490 family)
MLNFCTLPQTHYAFFDVDETLISMKSMFSFMALYFAHYPNPTLEHSFHQTMKKENIPREVKNANYYHFFRSFPVTNIRAACQLWFKQNAINNTSFYHQNILQQLKQHQAQGTECVLVSGSFNELLQPIADDLGVEHILSINLERDGLMFTGNIIAPQTIGMGKADAMKAFLLDKPCDPKDCFAYGDDISDVPMLEVVGNPRAVSGGRRLEDYARERGWRVLEPH